jgi:hypothetical protein
MRHSRSVGTILVGLLGLVIASRGHGQLTIVVAVISVAVLVLGIWRLYAGSRAAGSSVS